MLNTKLSLCAGDGGAAYGVDIAQFLARTEENQDADGWEDCNVSGSELIVECQLIGLPPAASRQTSLRAGVALHSGRLLLQVDSHLIR